MSLQSAFLKVGKDFNDIELIIAVLPLTLCCPSGCALLYVTIFLSFLICLRIEIHFYIYVIGSIFESLLDSRL